MARGRYGFGTVKLADLKLVDRKSNFELKVIATGFIGPPYRTIGINRVRHEKISSHLVDLKSRFFDSI